MYTSCLERRRTPHKALTECIYKWRKKCKQSCQWFPVSQPLPFPSISQRSSTRHQKPSETACFLQNFFCQLQHSCKHREICVLIQTMSPSLSVHSVAISAGLQGFQLTTEQLGRLVRTPDSALRCLCHLLSVTSPFGHHRDTSLGAGLIFVCSESRTQ